MPLGRCKYGHRRTEAASAHKALCRPAPAEIGVSLIANCAAMVRLGRPSFGGRLLPALPAPVWLCAGATMLQGHARCDRSARLAALHQLRQWFAVSHCFARTQPHRHAKNQVLCDSAWPSRTCEHLWGTWLGNAMAQYVQRPMPFQSSSALCSIAPVGRCRRRALVLSCCLGAGLCP